jgi:GNAT superfamily N-acetyltransferase
MTQAPVELRTLTGPAIRPHIETLARMRRIVFRDFPYLYDGDEASERTQLAWFAASEGAALVVAFDGSEAVGCSSCVPAPDEEEAVQAPLRARGVDPAEVMYFGESVLLQAYRGQGIGVHFFEQREAHGRARGSRLACFCSVRRPEDHPLRPPGYTNLHGFWRNRGFRPWPGPPVVFAWKQVDGPDKVRNELDLWVKDLA